MPTWVGVLVFFERGGEGGWRSDGATKIGWEQRRPDFYLFDARSVMYSQIFSSRQYEDLISL